MAGANDVALVFGTILSIPGMQEMVKIDLRISRNNVLLLNHVIERGLSNKEGDKPSDLLALVPKEALEELKTIADTCLDKAGLIELSQKLSGLSSK